MNNLQKISHRVNTRDPQLLQYVREVSAIPLLSSEEQQTIKEEWKGGLSKKSFNRVIESHLMAVVKMAFKYKNFYSIELIDLICEGNLGLLRAIEKYDPFSPYTFYTYAIHWIDLYIKQYLRKNTNTVVSLSDNNDVKKVLGGLQLLKRKYNQTHLDYLSDDGLENISTHLGVKKETVQLIDNYTSGVKRVDVIDCEEFLRDDSPTVEDRLIEVQEMKRNKWLIRNALEKLPLRDREIISDLYLRQKPLSKTAISEKHGISCERVRQIESRALKNMKKEMVSKVVGG